MQDILVRTLRREFRFEAPPEAFSLRFLESRPLVSGAAVTLEYVTVEHAKEHFRARFASRGDLEGSLRYISAQLDYFVLSCALADEPDAISLPAALLKSPAGQRVLFVGGRKSGKTMLAIALLSAGWAFEGDHRVFIGNDGIAAHPRTVRISYSLLRRHASLAPLLDGAPSLNADGPDTIYAIDPTRWGQDWHVAAGKINAAFFLENADSVLSSIRRIGADEAFGRTLRLFSATHAVTVRQIALLRSLVAVPSFYLELGGIDGAVEAVTTTLRAVSPD
jgi:hypothetical protein